MTDSTGGGGIMISSLRTINKILDHIVGETKRSPCPTANNPSIDFICMNATLKDSIHSRRNVIRITLYSAQITPLCNRPSGTRPSGFFSPTQWKFSLPTTQRIFFFTQPFLCFPSDCTLHTQRIFANKQKIKII